MASSQRRNWLSLGSFRQPNRRVRRTLSYRGFETAGLTFVVDTLVDENDGSYSAGDLSLCEAIGLSNGTVGPNSVTFASVPAYSGADGDGHGMIDEEDYALWQVKTRAKCATAIWTRSSGCSRCWPATKSGALTHAATTEPTRRCYWMRAICIKQRQIKDQGQAA
jgi:hypothetical protein